MDERAQKLRQYLESLPRDVRDILVLAEDTALPQPARRLAVAALNYLLLRLDLVPDWVPMLGLCDDAAVLRVAMASLADLETTALPAERMVTVGRLANEADALRDLLGDELYESLRRYVDARGGREIQGRKPDSILGQKRVLETWKRDIEGVLKDYRPDLSPMKDPDKVTRDLLSYFRAKLASTKERP
jgi:uncharacterized membrane protein YkvA (DUF1232 family)